MKLKTQFYIVLAGVFLSLSAQATLVTGYSGDGNDILASSVTPGMITDINGPSVWGDVSNAAGLAAGTAKWISYANTGSGGVVAPNTTDRNNNSQATAHFQRKFNIGGAGILDLWLLTDDTATVTLTGPGGTNTLWSAYSGQVDPCAPGGTGTPVGCVNADMGTYSTSGLSSGAYTLDVYAFQTNGDVFGSQYAMKYSSASVPEPGTLALFGIGLFGLAFRLRKKA